MEAVYGNKKGNTKLNIVGLEIKSVKRLGGKFDLECYFDNEQLPHDSENDTNC